MTPAKGWSLDFADSRRLGAFVVRRVPRCDHRGARRPGGGLRPGERHQLHGVDDGLHRRAGMVGRGLHRRGRRRRAHRLRRRPGRRAEHAGKIVYGPDLSLESQAPNLTNLDTFGHGTFMAGIIAGRDAALTAPYEQAPASAYRGVAPDARIVSLKVATADGGTDVSQVIAAIDWVVQHRNDNGMNIRVLNLSYGTNSTQWFGIDPLAYAAERAWDAGIVVVAAAGNSGYQTKGSSPALANPAYDKRIIAVGSSDPMGTVTLADDTMPDFSAAAKTGSARAPDLVAPGVHLQGLRVQNSWIDTNVDGKAVLDERFMRGSGTSESAAIVSGAAALILDKFPHATPDQVKRLLKLTAYDLPSQNTRQVGSGELRLGTALSAALPIYVQTVERRPRRRVPRGCSRLGSSDP